MVNNKASKFKSFYTKNHEERINLVKNFAQLNEQEVSVLKNLNALNFDQADKLIENVISVFQMPLGIATNFIINKKEYLIPMATEEPSVIAAASKAAKMSNTFSGFSAKCSKSIMIGQIQLKNVKNISKARQIISKNKKELLDLANSQDKKLINLGGGAIDIKTKKLKIRDRKYLIAEIFIDTLDAMGANIVNTMCEKIAPRIEVLTNSNANLKIVSNLAINRIAWAKATWQLEPQVIDDFLDAYYFAQKDIFRASTHNKGIMNGIDSVAIAVGNDFRALEAGAHTYACYKTKYAPLTKYRKKGNNKLEGEIKLPIAAGTFGGITQAHPMAKISLKILKVKKASELCQVLASVGLAQNFAAIYAMVTEGIQKGHMNLHNKKFNNK